MSMTLLSTVGSSIRFNTYDNVNGKKTFEGEVLSVFSGKAHPLPATAKSQHINIYPLLPESVQEVTPDDYQQYNFFTLLQEDGTTETIGIPWVTETSIEEVVEQSVNIVIKNFTDPNFDRLRLILVQNGYDVDKIT
ncbi:hypothetical protein [Vibrio phage BONAISHI]|nr:hypothetical protein [Vibrio phage BONAISHI]